jgi:hypothetical protein
VTDPFRLNRLIEGYVDELRKAAPIAEGTVVTVEGSFASVDKGNGPVQGFAVLPQLVLHPGDPVLFIDQAGLKVVLAATQRNALGLRSGAWTPELRTSTPGNLTAAYSEQSGSWRRIGDVVLWSARVTTSTWTHTTASGAVQLAGLPFTVAEPDAEAVCAMSGWTKASYTQLAGVARAGGNHVEIHATGSGQALATLAAGDLPTGGTVNLRAAGAYYTAEA